LKILNSIFSDLPALLRKRSASPALGVRFAKPLLALALSLTVLPFFCLAQSTEEPGLIVEDVGCKGNAVTSCQFILGHLHLAKGDRLNEDEIQSARLKLSSLPNFISVDIHLEKGSKKGKVLVVVEVVEADRVENELTMGTSKRLSSLSQIIEGRFADHDVFGTRNTVNLDVEGIVPMGGLERHGVYARLQFVDPKLLDSSRYFLISGITYQNTYTVYPDNLVIYPNGDSNKTNQLGIDVSVGRRIFDYSYVTVGYLHRQISQSFTQYVGGPGAFSTNPDPNADKGFSFGYGWNSEDDPYFPTRGSRLTANFGTSWASARFRKTWSSGPDSAWTVQFGGTPGTQYRESLDESQDFSVAYGRAISPSDAFGGIRNGRWYVEPGISYYGTSSYGRDLAEWGVKAGIRLDTKAFGMIELYVMASTGERIRHGH
jgi:Omp85 superfamily domain